jgi:hypothetical protein
MKVTRLFVAACMCLWLTSCIEINENVEIKENGSGKISTTTDLSQLVDMMQAFGGEEMDKRKDEKIDTLIEMKSIVDTAKNLTADQKALLKNGKVRLKMNLAEKVFNVNMEFPFDNMEKYQQLNNLLSSGAGGMGNVMKALMGNEPGGATKDTTQIIDQPAQIGSPDMDQLTSVFDFNASNGLIKKTLNKEKYNKLMNDPQVQQMKQASDMGMEMLYTTTFKLPRPVKKVDNPAAKISDDKKTVTIRQNFLEIFSAPEKFEYTIQY